MARLIRLSRRWPWFRGGSPAAVFAVVGALGAGCGNSSETCEEICAWYAESCLDSDSCVEDCVWASPDDFDHAQSCIDTTPSSCRAASCCLRFEYEPYAYQQECLING